MDLGNMYYTSDQFRRAQDEEEEAWAKLGAIAAVMQRTADQPSTVRGSR